MAHRMLLADDSLTIQKVVELTFSDTDIELLALGSGDRAIEILDELRPDIVLADAVMPGRTGYEVCEAVKSRSWGRFTPVVLLTGTFEPFDRGRAERVGCDSIITKPFDAHSMAAQVRELLAKAAASKEQAASAPPAPAAEEADVFGGAPAWEAPLAPELAASELVLPPPEDLYATTALKIPSEDELRGMEERRHAGESAVFEPAFPAPELAQEAPPEAGAAPAIFEASAAPEPVEEPSFQATEPAFAAEEAAFRAEEPAFPSGEPSFPAAEPASEAGAPAIAMEEPGLPSAEPASFMESASALENEVTLELRPSAVDREDATTPELPPQEWVPEPTPAAEVFELSTGEVAPLVEAMSPFDASSAAEEIDLSGVIAPVEEVSASEAAATEPPAADVFAAEVEPVVQQASGPSPQSVDDLFAGEEMLAAELAEGEEVAEPPAPGFEVSAFAVTEMPSVEDVLASGPPESAPLAEEPMFLSGEPDFAAAAEPEISPAPEPTFAAEAEPAFEPEAEAIAAVEPLAEAEPEMLSGSQVVEDIFAVPQPAAPAVEPFDMPSVPMAVEEFSSPEPVAGDIVESIAAFERSMAAQEILPPPTPIAREADESAEEAPEPPIPQELEALAASSSLTELIPTVAPSPKPASAAPYALTEADVDRIARRVVEILSDRAVRDVAWEVVPEMAERLVRSRLEELERG